MIKIQGVTPRYEDDQDQREVARPTTFRNKSDRRFALCRTTRTGGHLTRRPFLVREPVFRQASVAKTSCLHTTIRAIAKEHRNVSYGKNLHIAVVVVFVVVVHGCERNARR